MSDTIAVIFDMDGVLIDSYRAHFESWRRLAAENGREYSEADFAAGFGRTSREVIAEQWNGGNRTEGRIAELADRKEALFREVVADDFPGMDGAAELMRALHDRGAKLAVGSSGPPENVHLAVEKLDIAPIVEATVTGADVDRGKPDPQVFQLAAERLEVPPERCVVIEDAPVGVQAARAAGMKVVGLASTGRRPEELQGADRVVRSLRELDVEELSGLALD